MVLQQADRRLDGKNLTHTWILINSTKVALSLRFAFLLEHMRQDNALDVCQCAMELAHATGGFFAQAAGAVVYWYESYIMTRAR